MTIAFIIGGIVLAVICVSAFVEGYFYKKKISSEICSYLAHHQLLDRKRASLCYDEEKKAKRTAIIAPIAFAVVLILVSLGTQNPFLVISFVITLMCLVFNVEEKTKPTVDSVYGELLRFQDDISHDKMNEFLDWPPSYVSGPSFEMLKEAYERTTPRKCYLQKKKEEEKRNQENSLDEIIDLSEELIDDLQSEIEIREKWDSLASLLAMVYNIFSTAKFSFITSKESAMLATAFYMLTPLLHIKSEHIVTIVNTVRYALQGRGDPLIWDEALPISSTDRLPELVTNILIAHLNYNDDSESEQEYAIADLLCHTTIIKQACERISSKCSDPNWREDDDFDKYILIKENVLDFASDSGVQILIERYGEYIANHT